MKFPVSVWMDYFKELPGEQAIEELSAIGFTHRELSFEHLSQLMAKSPSCSHRRSIESCCAAKRTDAHQMGKAGLYPNHVRPYTP